MSKNRHYKAYESMVKLRYNKVQAARDVFYMHTLLEAEEDLKANKKNIALELITVPRNRRALVASEIVMFMQQVCSWRFFFPPTPPPPPSSSPPLSRLSIYILMLLLNFGLVLRRQCHCILQFPDFPRRRFRQYIRALSQPRLWYNQLALCYPSRVYY